MTLVNELIEKEASSYKIINLEALATPITTNPSSKRLLAVDCGLLTLLCSHLIEDELYKQIGWLKNFSEIRPGSKINSIGTERIAIEFQVKFK